ncbi:hypothetical protein SAMN06265370_1046 [Puniceibacterium sediminis]|uniref:Integrase n=1 Tax=Puniceibacterium sediminis TaxID=1608407 RepID=A0A238VZI1_9RHOB|nr:hypothetical protein SAMN06265370_1046 [Puniceibacterium sediminis]
MPYSWVNHDAKKSNPNAPLLAMPFLNFARSYMRYQHAMKPTKSFNNRLAALRALERALTLVHETPSIVEVDPEVFNRAQALIKEKYNTSTAYRTAGQLQLVAEFLNTHSLVPVRFQWKHNLKRNNDRNRVGKNFDENRLDKLPTSGAIDALAKAFQLATEQNDIIIASTGALLTAAPNRINEIFRLPTNCVVERIQPDGSVAYGLRWWPSKDADPYVKWIGTTMSDVAKEAIRKIRKETDDARSMAQWYESNPGSMWLPPEYEYLRTQTISAVQDFCHALGIKNHSTINQWMKNKGIPIQKISNSNHVRFVDVQKAVLTLLPKDFPVYDRETGMTFSEALMVAPYSLFHQDKATIPCMIEPISSDKIYNGLGNGTNHGKSSLFTRLRLHADDGSCIQIRTHQFRHWLNTIAQRGGLSQLDIAKWSGRRDIRQNRDYDHVSSDEMLMIVRGQLGTSNMLGPLAEIIGKVPVTQEDFLQMKFPTAHTTEFGFCIHDFAMLPCQRHRDCINCTEHVCIKGDAAKATRIRASLELVNDQIESAKVAMEDDSFGADRWLHHHERTAARLQSLIEIFEDPLVQDGSVIQLSNLEEYSPIANAIDDRKLSDDVDSRILSDFRALKRGRL